MSYCDDLFPNAGLLILCSFEKPQNIVSKLKNASDCVDELLRSDGNTINKHRTYLSGRWTSICQERNGLKWHFMKVQERDITVSQS